MTQDAKQGLSTRSIHGSSFKDAQGSPHTPIYDTTTFGFASTADVLDVVEGKKVGNLYTRYGFNPTIRSVEETLAGLEGAQSAWVFSSGMAALSATFLTHGRDGIVCIGDAYGGTLELLAEQLPMLGIETRFLLGSQLEQLDAALQEGAKLVFFETPTNPVLEIFDIRAIAAKAHAHGAYVVVDNTFASPVNQSPLAFGADLVVHSATKYLGGHSDLTAGAVMGSKEVAEPIWNWRKNLGSMLAPTSASLLARSLRTLVVRVEQQNKSAQQIAEYLTEHPKVERVLYAGLPDFEGHALAKEQMRGFGGMLSFDVAGGRAAATRAADRLKIFTLAPSLGGTESLVTQPCTSTHNGVGAEERARRGISEAMLRLSVGLENVEDLIADLDQALEG